MFWLTLFVNLSQFLTKNESKFQCFREIFIIFDNFLGFRILAYCLWFINWGCWSNLYWYFWLFDSNSCEIFQNHCHHCYLRLTPETTIWSATTLDGFESLQLASWPLRTSVIASLCSRLGVYRGIFIILVVDFYQNVWKFLLMHRLLTMENSGRAYFLSSWKILMMKFSTWSRVESLEKVFVPYFVTILAKCLWTWFCTTQNVFVFVKSRLSPELPEQSSDFSKIHFLSYTFSHRFSHHKSVTKWYFRPSHKWGKWNWARQGSAPITSFLFERICLLKIFLYFWHFSRFWSTSEPKSCYKNAKNF